MTARIRFGADVCSDPAMAMEREWLETNGIGGYAASTVCGTNTRRYHGLLVAATKPPSERHVLLSKVEETLVVAGERFELSTNLYPGVRHPAGYRYLREFRLDPWPVWVFEAGGVRLTKGLCLVEGENSLALEYIAEGPRCSLELRPLVAFRGYHELMASGGAWDTEVREAPGLLTIQPLPGLPPLHFGHSGRRTSEAGQWYFRFEYPVERDRGFDFQEDLYCPFALEYELEAGKRAGLVISTEPHRAEEAGALLRGEEARREVLSIAPDQFIVRRAGSRTVMAGYPWFGEWYRDTMISLPGLTLVSGRFDVAREILGDAVRWIDQGMLPNRFPDGSERPEYNTVDATLWMFEAVRKYLAYTEDLSFVRERLYPAMKSVIEWHAKGTRFGIAMDDDGLLRAGDETTQLTWMDARVAGLPVTPRHGRAVEIQALWYNALRVMASLAAMLDTQAAQKRYDTMADRVAASFAKMFWNEAAGCFYDAVDGDRRDGSVRPNQLIGLSLGYCAVEGDRARRVLQVVRDKLRTPFGLRTLSPDNANYRGRYAGGVAERDGAYHQGTVWPWLLGPYITAEVRFNGEEGRRRGAEILSGLRDFVASRGVGQMPEIFDGDEPHEPRGCFAQAWSVAELERVDAECFTDGVAR